MHCRHLSKFAWTDVITRRKGWVSRGSKTQAGVHPRRQTRLTPWQTRRTSLPPFELALMFSIKSKRHSDGGRCARNPNRGHKPSERQRSNCSQMSLALPLYAVARATARVFATSEANSFLRSTSDMRHSHPIMDLDYSLITRAGTPPATHDFAIAKCRSSRLFFQSRLTVRVFLSIKENGISSTVNGRGHKFASASNWKGKRRTELTQTLRFGGQRGGGGSMPRRSEIEIRVVDGKRRATRLPDCSVGYVKLLKNVGIPRINERTRVARPGNEIP